MKSTIVRARFRNTTDSRMAPNQGSDINVADIAPIDLPCALNASRQFHPVWHCTSNCTQCVCLPLSTSLSSLIESPLYQLKIPTGTTPWDLLPVIIKRPCTVYMLQKNPGQKVLTPREMLLELLFGR